MRTPAFLPCLALLLLPREGAAQRRFLILDEGRKNLVMVDEASPSSGWTRNLGVSRGMQLIGNNRVLVSTPAGYLEAELGSGEILLRVERWTGVEDARRLPDGHVLLGANVAGKITLIEVDQNCLEIQRNTLDVPNGSGMRQMRMGGDGNLYIAAENKVHIATRGGSLLKSLTVPHGSGCYKALRSDDGTIWVSSGYGGTVVRMSPAGTVLKTFSIPDELKSPVAADPNFLSDFQILGNGNILAAVWHGHSETAGGHGKALIEFDAQGGVVWTWEGGGLVSSVHGAIELGGIDPGILHDERAGPVTPLAYAFPAQGPGIQKVTWNAAELFKEVSEIVVPPAPPDTASAYPNGNNYVTLYKGYMLVPFASDHMANQGGFQFWDLGDLRNPKPVFTHNDKTTRNNVEAHGYGFATVGGKDYGFFQDKQGVSIWDFTDIRNLKKVGALSLPGIGAGGYDNGVFGVFYQHPYIYAAGSAHGVFVIDARDPAKPKLVRQIPAGTWGNFRIGNTWAVGNILLASTVRGGNSRGLAFFDISDPANPVFLSAPETKAKGGFYSALLNGNRIYLGGDDSPAGLFVYEIFDFPNLVLDGEIPQLEGIGEYQFVQDDNVIWGMESLWYKAGLKDGNFRILGSGKFPETTFHGQQEGHPTPLGNVVLVGDDHTRASGIHVHDLKPDDQPPVVNMVAPSNGAVGQAPTSRIGVSFSDQVDIQSIHGKTFMVRPKGGDALPGHYSVQQCIANFTPAAPLAADRIYEIVIRDVKDVSGNPMAAAFVAAFSTGVAPFIPPGTVLLKGRQIAVSALAAEGSSAANAHDGNPATYWQAPGQAGPAGQAGLAAPIEVILDLKSSLSPSRFSYYPRKDAAAGGFITRYEFLISENTASWTRVAQGNWDANANTKRASFLPARARYLKLVILAASGGSPSAAEFSVEAETGGTAPIAAAHLHRAPMASTYLAPFGRILHPDIGKVIRVEVSDAAGRKRAMLEVGGGNPAAFAPGKGLHVLGLHGEKGMVFRKVVY